jgi:glycosyltransferase involved in cell wall biosynthesis
MTAGSGCDRAGPGVGYLHGDMAARIAFVPPRFGPQVIGGSEAVTREIAIALAERDWDVEVLTTCATNHYSWANELAEGESEEDGVCVRRFANRYHSSATGLSAQQKIQAGVLPTADEQVSWLSWRFSVPGLFEHLLRYGADYDAVVFSPYLFWTTTVCMPIVRERAVVMPCLHVELYARLDVVRPALTQPARLWFLSQPEHDLAHRIAPLTAPHAVTGAGVDVPESYDPDGFRARHGLQRPFLLFAGRREPEKGWDWLVEAFTGAVVDHGVDMDLVTIGVGDVDPPSEIRDRVVDLGSLSSEERDNAMAAATAYAQPSRMESFSRSVMEAWLAGTPVLAIEGGEVVAWHCARSGGGRTFGDAASLAASLHELTGDGSLAADMAARGRAYVLEHYTWPVVVDRIEAQLREMR